MKRDGALASALALIARLAVSVWAADRFPPAGDGTYYHTLATRMAEGHGYTWAWPDGAVTYAAHYPVGYPALMALGYVLFGAHPFVAMVLNALLGAAMTFAVYHLVFRFSDGAAHRRAPLLASLVVGLHPALVPYTAALMTEGVTAALLTIAAALASEARAAARARSVALWLGAAGIVMGIATLVRPQSLVLAPVLGALALAPLYTWRARVLSAAGVLAVTLLCCAPWTLRNCMHMHRCALVSVNAGWNLFIGEETTSGAWEEIRFPPECGSVWDEAAKDVCLEQVARRKVAASPVAWLERVPKKLAVTFDYFGAAPWYLHVSNAQAFPDRAKVALGAVETVAARVLLVGALFALAWRPGPRRRVRIALGILGVIFALSPTGWPAYLVLATLAALASWAVLARPGSESLLLGWTAAVIGATAVTHAAFFGAGRYGLVVVPFISALATLGLPSASRSTGKTEIP